MKEVMDIVLGILGLAYMVLGVFALQEQYRMKDYKCSYIRYTAAAGWCTFKLLTYSL